MALTPLRESLEQTGTAFDQKLNQLVGLAESVKASEVRKQQMAEKLAQEKDMVQFRSDVQLEKQKKYYRDITEPQQQAERDYQRMQQRIEQLNESRKETRESIEEMQKKTSQGQHSTLYKYNLEQFNYGLDTKTDQEGNIAGFAPKVYYGQGENAEEIPASGFYDMVSSLTSFGNELESAEKSDLKTHIDQEKEIYYLGGDDEGSEIIQQIKSDPDKRKYYYALFQDGRLQVSNRKIEGDGDGEGGSPTSQAALNNSLPVINRLSERIQEEGSGGVVKFGFHDRNLEDDWSIGNLWEDKEKYVSAVDFSTSIGDVQLQLNKVVKQTLPKNAKFDIAELTDEEKAMIVNGEIDDETLDSVAPEDRANHVRRMANMNESTRQTYHDLFKFHNAYESAFMEVLKGSGQNVNRNEYMLDLMGAPQDLTIEKNFRKLFKEVDENERGNNLTRVYQMYSKNPTAEFLDKFQFNK